MNNPQDYLDEIAKEDRYGFLDDVKNWANHRILLYLGLELTKDSTLPVLEMGSGDGSTEYLKNYCTDKEREFYTYDSNKEWADKTISVYVEDWDKSDIFDKRYSVCFIDHAPGEHRYIAIQKLVNKCDVMVIHDSEPEATGYRLSEIWHLFKYRLDYRTIAAWATIVSNTIDVTQFDNCILNNFLLQKG